MKLINWDCLIEMQNIKDKSLDIILCDLPYWTTNCKWDTIIDLDLLWKQYKEIIKDNWVILLFAQTPFDKVLWSSNLEMLKYEWIWEKTQATWHLNAKKMPMKAHENILVFYKNLPLYNPQKTIWHKPINSYTKYIETQNNTEIYWNMNKEIKWWWETDRFPRSVLKFKSDKQTNYYHPTQKPVELYKYLLRTYWFNWAVCLDNCSWSWTLWVAINELKNEIQFEWILIEKDEKYFEIAKERIENNLK